MESVEGQIEDFLKEFMKLEDTMRELHLMKLVINDLKSFKRMMKLKKYD
ncbi:MAG: hypothetical protein QXT06_02740 [Candidatus Bathyarchaeia archaeon]